MGFLFDLSQNHLKWQNVARLYGCHENSEDVVQSMYLTSVKYKDAIMRSGELSQGYIYCIIKTICIDHHRKKQQTVSIEDVNVSEDFDFVFSIEEHDVLQDLNSEEYEIYELYYQQNLSTREIAIKKDYSNHVKVWRRLTDLKEKIHKRLMQKLENYECKI